MGVRGLETFLEQHCASACYEVDIAELAKKYKNDTGNDAVIVIDARSCYSNWCKGLDNVIGYEIQELLYRLRVFVESFSNIGIKIVFIFGGVTVEKKRKTWIGRRMRALQDVYIVSDLLGNDNITFFQKQRLEKHSFIPPSTGLIISYLLKYVLNCEVYATIEECDEEIVEYVNKNECMAIFARDTDYIVSDINCEVLSSKWFSTNDMTTLLYDRKVLATILGIGIDQLPLLGIMAGNDLIEYSILKDFHSSICGIQFENFVEFDILMPAIARLIKNLPDRPIDEILELICVKMFGDNSSLDLVKCAYNGYQFRESPKITNPSTEWSRILQRAQYRHNNTIAPPAIWGVLNDQVFELGACFEDLRKSYNNRIIPNSFVPSATVTRLLRQRIYGILLYEYEDSASVEIKEWCGEDMNSFLKPVLVKPVEPTVPHPGLIQLWSDEDDEVCEMKCKLFLSSISPGIIHFDEWYALTADLVALTATLFYLFEQEFIKEREMIAVMATVATYPLYSREKLRDLDFGARHPRCTHISVAVIRTFTMVIMSMAACGYPIPLSGDLIYMKFEAKLFQFKFKEMEQKKSVEEMCENDIQCMKIFNQMKNVLGHAISNSSKKHSNGSILKTQPITEI